MLEQTKSKFTVRKIILLAILSAMAYLLVLVINIPIVPGVEFLKYEPKDVAITIGAFLFGPFEAILISIVVSFVEMVTISTTGPIGLLMNIISSCCYAGIAGAIYKRKRTMGGAVIGLVTGALAMTAIMLLWNYLITPIYQGVPREAIATMLLPVFAPYNLIKAALNGAIVMIIYKPLVLALRKSGLAPAADGPHQPTTRSRTIAVTLVAAFVFAAMILLILVMNGAI